MTKAQAEKPPEVEKAEQDPFEHLVPGRIVWFWPGPHLERVSCAGPWPAMVTKVDGSDFPGRVTLNVNVPVPTPIGTDPVQRIAAVLYAGEKPEDSADDSWREGRWTWIFPMPDRTA
jgi:hypothetical protein